MLLHRFCYFPLWLSLPAKIVGDTAKVRLCITVCDFALTHSERVGLWESLFAVLKGIFAPYSPPRVIAPSFTDEFSKIFGSNLAENSVFKNVVHVTILPNLNFCLTLYCFYVAANGNCSMQLGAITRRIWRNFATVYKVSQKVIHYHIVQNRIESY